MAQSLARGRRVTLSKVDSFAGEQEGGGGGGGHQGQQGRGSASGAAGRGQGLGHQHLLRSFCACLPTPSPLPLATPCAPPPPSPPCLPDGVAVKHVGAETFRLCRDLLDGVMLVDNAAVSNAIKVCVCVWGGDACWWTMRQCPTPSRCVLVCVPSAASCSALRSPPPCTLPTPPTHPPTQCMQDVFEETRSILEPAGAVAVAGAKAWLQRPGASQGHTGGWVVVGGGWGWVLSAMPMCACVHCRAFLTTRRVTPPLAPPPPTNPPHAVVAVTSGANMNFDRLRLVAGARGVAAAAAGMWRGVGLRERALAASPIPPPPPPHHPPCTLKLTPPPHSPPRPTHPPQSLLTWVCVRACWPPPSPSVRAPL